MKTHAELKELSKQVKVGMTKIYGKGLCRVHIKNGAVHTYPKNYGRPPEETLKILEPFLKSLPISAICKNTANSSYIHITLN